jgi:hypothetical protein
MAAVLSTAITISDVPAAAGMSKPRTSTSAAWQCWKMLGPPR